MEEAHELLFTEDNYKPGIAGVKNIEKEKWERG